VTDGERFLRLTCLSWASGPWSVPQTVEYTSRVDADVEACLPAALRGRRTTIAKIAAGLSGAGVYRVVADGRSYVLKLAGPRDAIDGWRARTAMLCAAADAGVAPAVVHVDDERRAVVTELVVDRSFAARLTQPSTRDAAIRELGVTLRRVHALPLPDNAVAGREPRAFLDEIWTGLRGFPLPAWTADVVRRVLDEPPPPTERAPVLSHNDPNPSNLVHDGARLLLLDWDTAGANDPFYDLAAVAVFLRMDDPTCAQLVAAHDEAPIAPSLPASFVYLRRAISALCGAMFLHVARASGHAGARGDETFELAPTLADVHGSMRAGMLSARTPDGQWAYARALLKASAQL
jgi:aminoglycoside phosphotransferase (APT) family kinase protein